MRVCFFFSVSSCLCVALQLMTITLTFKNMNAGLDRNCEGNSAPAHVSEKKSGEFKVRMQRRSKRNPKETLDSVGGSVRSLWGVSQLPFSKEEKNTTKHRKCLSLIATQSPDNLLESTSLQQHQSASLDFLPQQSRVTSPLQPLLAHYTHLQSPLNDLT